MDNLGTLAEKYKNKEITVLELSSQIEKYKNDPELYCLKSETNNGNCSTLPYHPDHPKGALYQNVIKKLILKAIDFAHILFIKEYDKNGFVFKDPRLNKINLFCRNYVDINFPHDRDYKLPFMNKILDIIFSIVKYDRYYSPRFFDFINKFQKEFPDGFELLSYEQDMLRKRKQ